MEFQLNIKNYEVFMHKRYFQLYSVIFYIFLSMSLLKSQSIIGERFLSIEFGTQLFKNKPNEEYNKSYIIQMDFQYPVWKYMDIRIGLGYHYYDGITQLWSLNYNGYPDDKYKWYDFKRNEFGGAISGIFHTNLGLKQKIFTGFKLTQIYANKDHIFIEYQNYLITHFFAGLQLIIFDNLSTKIDFEYNMDFSKNSEENYLINPEIYYWLTSNLCLSLKIKFYLNEYKPKLMSGFSIIL